MAIKAGFRWIVTAGAGIALAGLLSCSEVGYYGQCVKGHLDLLARRQPITELVRDPDLDSELRNKLAQILRVREFASEELHLPDNGSYRCYADLERPYAVWNVVAAPEFSLEPRRWCFPIAGCVSYRGYFSRQAAEDFADPLRRRGDDVYLYGVSAYSTLGWFDDPVLNTFCDRSLVEVAGVIFHELAHQKVYVADDSAFNEAFAEAVEQAGVERWLEATGASETRPGYRKNRRRQAEFVDLLLQAREDLATLYASDLPVQAMREQKQRRYAALRADYQLLKQQWGGYAGFDRWMAEDLNNAKLSSISTYHRAVKAFRDLLEGLDHDFRAFFRRVAALEGLPPEVRMDRLREVAATPVAGLPNTRYGRGRF